MKIRAHPLLATSLILAGCAHDPVAENRDIHRYAIVAGQEGLPVRTSIDDAGQVKFEGRMNAADHRVYLEPMMTAIRHAPVRGGKRQILIFIHGGMNEGKGAVARSARLTTKLREDYHPIFIDWNSAPVSTYLEHLLFVRQGKRQPFFGPLTSPIYLASDIARGVSRAPLVWSSLVHSSLTQPGAIVRGKQERKRIIVAQEILKDETASTGHGPHVTRATIDENDERSRASQIGVLPHSLFFLPKAVTATLIDIIGTGAWDMMLRRSTQLFDSPTRRRDVDDQDRRDIDEIARIITVNQHETADGRNRIHFLAARLKEPPTPPDLHRGAEFLGQSRQGAVSQFLDELEHTLGPHPERRYSITLVGHSMGAIISNEILSRHPDLPFDHIVYMAGACSIEECQRAVGGYLRHNKQAQFYNLCLHPYAEVGEATPPLPWKDRQLADYGKAAPGLLLPRGSLLVWLDTFFTKPVTLGGRRLGKWSAAITTAGAFPSEVRDRVHLRMFALGQGRGPETHGSFASENDAFAARFWEPAYWQPDGRQKPMAAR